MDKFNNSKDDFWDIEKLVPKKKAVLHPFAGRVNTAVHNISGTEETKSGEGQLTITRGETSLDGEELSYSPEYHGLIKRVTIRRSVDKFDFYGNFRKAALVYFDFKTPKCDFVPYYSYMPQYTQLNSEQKAYYFYWRDALRRGKYLKCDYSYLYLYVYEILNLPDKLDPEVGLDILCNLWREYRKELPRIDSYFSVWIQDYCLVHKLPCPTDKLSDFIFDILSTVELKEFYLSKITEAGHGGVDAIVSYLSDYDWRRTKYASGDNAEIFRVHMLGALERVVKELFSSSDLVCTQTAKITRSAFPHSLCTHAVKCRLEIEYVQISKDDGLRKMMTEAVRYTENKLRALLGVKSRLGVKGIGDDAKVIIDRYFESIYEIERIRRQRENAPEYEKQYDAQRESLSFESADMIERASWGTTARLVAEEDDIAQNGEISLGQAVSNPEHKSLIYDISEDAVHNTGTDTSDAFNSADRISNLLEREKSENDNLKSIDGLLPEDISALADMLSGRAATISDEAFERINEAFCDSPLGDVVLEYSDDGYRLIDDYSEDVKEMLFCS